MYVGVVCGYWTWSFLNYTLFLPCPHTFYQFIPTCIYIFNFLACYKCALWNFGMTEVFSHDLLAKSCHLWVVFSHHISTIVLLLVFSWGRSVSDCTNWLANLRLAHNIAFSCVMRKHGLTRMSMSFHFALFHEDYPCGTMQYGVCKIMRSSVLLHHAAERIIVNQL